MEDTRDIAVAANTKVDAHVEDCARFRVQLNDSFKTVNTTLTDLGDKITGLQIKGATVLGALIIASKLADWLIQWHGTK